MGNLVSIILAAGKASRMGAPKQLLPYGGKTVIEKMVELTTTLPNTRTLVVTGAYQKEVEVKLLSYPVGVIYNSNWQTGMGSSIAAGVNAAEKENPDGVIIILADQLAIQKEHLMGLIETFYQKNEQYCVCSFYKKIKGVPALFPKHWFGFLKNLRGDQGARKLLNERSEDALALPLAEAAIDIDTPKDWQDFIS